MIFKPVSLPPPKPIIVKFKSYRIRSEILQNRRKLRGKRKSIQEDLTALNAELLSIARKTKKVEAAWSSNGRIQVLIRTSEEETTKKLITCKDDLKKI